MKTWTIYEHISPSGKVYVGITCKKPEARWENGAGYPKCKMFYRAILKYGWNNIEHKIIATGLGEYTAKNMEKDLIAFNKAKGISYNITDGGEGSLGVIASEKKREHARNIWKGKTIPQDIRDKISKGHKGLKFTEAHREKIRKSKLGNTCNNKAIVFIKNGKIMMEFNSCKEAANFFNCIPNSISRCARKVYKTFKGYDVTYRRDLPIFHPNLC